jgi:hypothetical protein
MLQELLARWPHGDSMRGVWLALAIAAGGLVLWTAGARLSRGLFTLVGVGVGAWVGLQAPRWFGWEIDSTGTAICGALALGIASWLLHGVWVAMLLAAQLAAAGGAVAWHRLAMSGATWTWPKLTIATGFTASGMEIAKSLWNDLPHAIPIAAGVCLIAGIALAALWPKMGRVLTFAMLGSMLMAGGAVVAMQLGKPEWIAKLPQTAQAQGIVLASLVVFGAAVQWAILGRAEQKTAAKPKRNETTTTTPTGSPAAPPRAIASRAVVRDLRDTHRAPAAPAVVPVSHVKPMPLSLTMTYRLKEASR